MTEIQKNINLKPFNSFKTKAVASLFCRPQTEEELIDAIKSHPCEEKLVLGEGCNMFFTQNFNGLVIKPEVRGFNTLLEDGKHIDIEVGAGESWDNFVKMSVDAGLSGIERLSLIPGTVGAAPIQNIGAYGAEVKDTITAVKAVDLEKGTRVEFSSSECKFGYRNSIFKETRRYAVTAVSFRLNKHFAYSNEYAEINRVLKGNNAPTPGELRQAVIDIRSKKLPDHKVLPNAGSFFKNPILSHQAKTTLLQIDPQAPIFPFGENSFKTSAAYLIDKAGLKGYRQGLVGISDRHALIVVNYGTDDGNEILHFAKHVQNEVKRRFDVMLEPEVWIF